MATKGWTYNSVTTKANSLRDHCARLLGIICKLPQREPQALLVSESIATERKGKRGTDNEQTCELIFSLVVLSHAYL